ncbi:MAG: flagellar hook-basal body complex protein FliE [Lachnospiraceae bacterium]
MDISSLLNVSSQAIAQTANNVSSTNSEDGSVFSSIFNAALDNINTTNSYISDAENEELKFALGITDNTHDLTIALQKASTALQYTVAVRDKFIESYREIMNMQI